MHAVSALRVPWDVTAAMEDFGKLGQCADLLWGAWASLVGFIGRLGDIHAWEQAWEVTTSCMDVQRRMQVTKDVKILQMAIVHTA